MAKLNELGRAGIDTAKDIGEKTKDTAKDMGGKAKDVAQTAYETTRDTARSTGSTVKDATQAMMANVGKQWRKTPPQAMIAVALTLIQAWMRRSQKQAPKSMKQAQKNLKKAQKNLWNMEKKMEEAVGESWETTQKMVKKGGRQARENVARTMNTVTSGVNERREAVIAAAQDRQQAVMMAAQERQRAIQAGIQERQKMIQAQQQEAQKRRAKKAAKKERANQLFRWGIVAGVVMALLYTPLTGKQARIWVGLQWQRLMGSLREFQTNKEIQGGSNTPVHTR